MRELAHSLREACGQVFKHSMGTGSCENNPASALREALRPVATKHMAAVLEPAAAGALMRSIETYEDQAVMSGLRMTRPGRNLAPAVTPGMRRGSSQW